ncbi:MAG: hypothetical protein ACI9WC_001369 [Arenicella sp.]|jgi:hypothetical protein
MKLKTLLLLIVALCLQGQVLVKAQASDIVNYDSLDTTDGSGLLTKPQAKLAVNNAQAESNALSLCETDCVNPSDTLLGSADGVDAFSNCQSNCIRSEYSFMNLQSKVISIYTSDPNDSALHYVGLIYQCVEYARRWWMKNLGITFGSIDSAYEIIYLTAGKDIESGDSFSLSRSVNGTARRAPKRGDLLIYYATPDNQNWQYGHVAVIVGVDKKKGLVSLAEQNYSNQKWQNPKVFSRQIQMFEVGGRYQLIDVERAQNRNSSGGQIAGWVYPTTEAH